MSAKVVWLAAVLSTPSEGAEVIGVFGTKEKAVQAMDEYYAFFKEDTRPKREELLGMVIYRQRGLTVASVCPYELNKASSSGQQL